MKANKTLLAAAVTAILVLAAVFIALISTPENPEIHEHADFKVYLNGSEYNFSDDKYMTTENRTLSNFAHLHDMNGNIIHKHADDITLGFFFRTLNITFNSTCFVLDNDTRFCNEGEKTIKLYVNGVRSNDYGKYEPKDLDRILVTYGNDSESAIPAQMASVTNDSCIYSDKCPERGPPPPEASCAADGCVAEPDHR